MKTKFLYIIPKGIFCCFYLFFYQYLIPNGIDISSSQRDEISVEKREKTEQNAVGMI
jgi:hypothetical protein